MVGSAVVVAIALTVWWQWRLSERRTLRENLLPEGRRGLQALADGKLDDARRLLRQCVHALDVLGEPFAEEGRFRQANAELALMEDLAPRPLEEMISSADRSLDYVNDRIRGRAIVLDAPLERDASGHWSLGYVTFIKDTPIPLDIANLGLLSSVPAVDKVRVILGAKISQLVKDEGASWRLELEPNSGVWITEPAIADKLGLMSDADASAVLARQRSWTTGQGEKENPSK